jgi:hypothetical protein
VARRWESPERIHGLDGCVCPGRHIIRLYVAALHLVKPALRLCSVSFSGPYRLECVCGRLVPESWVLTHNAPHGMYLLRS